MLIDWCFGESRQDWPEESVRGCLLLDQRQIDVVEQQKRKRMKLLRRNICTYPGAHMSALEVLDNDTLQASSLPVLPLVS